MIGRGAYGDVSVRGGYAVKQFKKISHIIQEYMALQYVLDCRYIVKPGSVDLRHLQMEMELYDCSLSVWWSATENRTLSNVKIIFKDILLGLIELHDRQLSHGDLKPSNILVRRKPLGVVLGDCGFVSVAKYAKVERTAATYRDPTIVKDLAHDMYSFGLCLLEMMGSIKVQGQTSYAILQSYIRKHIIDKQYQDLLMRLLNKDRSVRPSARETLNILYGQSVKSWNYTPIVYTGLKNLSQDDISFIRTAVKKYTTELKINRGKRGYGALLNYLDEHHIAKSAYSVHIAATILILSAIFGSVGLKEDDVMDFCPGYTERDLHETIKKMIVDKAYLKLMLSPTTPTCNCRDCSGH